MKQSRDIEFFYRIDVYGTPCMCIQLGAGWEQEESQLKQLLFNIVWFILLNDIIYDGLIDAMEYLHGL